MADSQRRVTARRIPLCAEGLAIEVDPISTGRLAPAVALRVVAGGRPTSIGATLPAQHAELLAERIKTAALEACEAALFTPIAPEQAG
jgi:hypothetical protein